MSRSSDDTWQFLNKPQGRTINYGAIFVVIIGNESQPNLSLLMYPDGRVFRITINGSDTIAVAQIPEVVVKAPPVFADDEEYRQYMRYKRYATEVLQYAIESIRLYRKYQRETEGMKNNQAKRYAKDIQKDVKEDFTDHLK